MKRKFLFTIVFALAAVFSLQAKDGEPGLLVTTSPDGNGSPQLRASGDPTLYINGNDATVSIFVTATGLTPDQQIKITVPTEFTSSKKTLLYNANNEEVVIGLRASKPVSKGEIVVQIGDGTSTRKYNIVGYATPLPQKNISAAPVYPGGDDTEFTIYDADGFTPESNGYTFEIRAKRHNALSKLQPYASTSEGNGWQFLIDKDQFAIQNAEREWGNKILKNPTSQLGGNGTFYPDTDFHTYRFAVAPDNRIHIYRDGALVDIIRAEDFGLQQHFIDNDTEGELTENLLANGDFEGEWETYGTEGFAQAIQGWHIGAMDRWNAYEYVTQSAYNENHDLNNDVLVSQRETWVDGWGAAEYSQIINVVPGETYTFSALAKGGWLKKTSSYQGSLRIVEVRGQEELNQKVAKVESDEMQEYSMDYTVSAQSHQIRVYLYQEHADNWGNSPSTMHFDDAKLTGMKPATLQKIGFLARNMEIEYFNYDASGAYAPLESAINPSKNELTFNGIKATNTFTVKPTNLYADIRLFAPSGFSVSPETIDKDATEVEVTVTYNSSLPKQTGQLFLESNDIVSSVNLTGISALPQKDISAAPIYPGGNDTEFTVYDAEGFTPEGNGYTVEVKAKRLNALSKLQPFASTTESNGWQFLIDKDQFAIQNAEREWGDKKLINPNVNQGGSGLFYPDTDFHTYRFAVAPDNRIHTYRDGALVDIVRAEDFGLQQHFIDNDSDSEIAENLLVNGDFEGEWETYGTEGFARAIQGWHIGATDRWNAYEYVTQSAYDENHGYKNHTLVSSRETWADGWGAAEYSQIINVVPGETYTFSALAKGGWLNKTSSYQGSLRIVEVRGSEELNPKVAKVESDDMQEYSMDYTVSAQSHQIRVYLYQEHADNWGNSPSTMHFDDAKLTGAKPATLQKIGFLARSMEIEYFNYDITGAYAPVFGLGTEPTGIKNPIGNDAPITASVKSGLLYLNNAPASSEVAIYNASGSLVKKVKNYTGGIALPQKGFYVAVIKYGTETKSVKVVY